IDKSALSSTNSLPLPKKQKTIKDIVLNPSDNHISRRCKLSSLLKMTIKNIQILRQVSEEFSILRADAMNFGLSIVSKWIENGFSSSNFPLIMMPKFWIHLYRKVADDKDKRNERIKFSKNINGCFEAFDSTRRSETKGRHYNIYHFNTKRYSIEYLYSVPVLDRLHVAISNIYTSSIIQNISLHLTQNANLYIFRVLFGFLRGLRKSTNQSFNPRTIAAKSIELYKEYKDANIELKGFESQYKYIIKKASKDVFNNDAFESISDYTYAKNNSTKLVCFSAELLKEAISKPELKIKTWHVMPRLSNNMLFVPLSGVHAMHGVLERCFSADLKISQQVYTEKYGFEEKRVSLFCNIQLCALLTVAVIQHIPALIGPTSFEDHYGDVVWKNNFTF
ncbi:hypothetical protein AB4K20DRAFT_2003786, partial [Rhizopus microsporus]